MIWLDILLILLGLYVITQLTLPALFPKTFEKNWLFKKNQLKKDVEKMVRDHRETKEIKKDLEEINKD